MLFLLMVSVKTVDDTLFTQLTKFCVLVLKDLTLTDFTVRMSSQMESKEQSACLYSVM